MSILNPLKGHQSLLKYFFHENEMKLQNIQEDVDLPDFADYGSIEKLRAALHTPDANNRNELLINQLGLTPRFSGNVNLWVDLKTLNWRPC